MIVQTQLYVRERAFPEFKNVSVKVSKGTRLDVLPTRSAFLNQGARQCHRSVLPCISEECTGLAKMSSDEICEGFNCKLTAFGFDVAVD